MNRSIRMLSRAAVLALGSGSIALAQGGANTGASGVVNPNCVEQPGTTGSMSGAASGSGTSMGASGMAGSTGVSGNSARQTGGSSGGMSGSGSSVAAGPSGTGPVGNVSGNSAGQTGGC